MDLQLKPEEQTQREPERLLITGEATTMPKPNSDTASISPEVLAVSARQIVERGIVPVSLRKWRRMDAAGECPRGFKLGGCKLWRMADLKLWAMCGFPDRVKFEARLKAMQN